MRISDQFVYTQREPYGSAAVELSSFMNDLDLIFS